jgi:type III secretion system chaperone SycN
MSAETAVQDLCAAIGVAPRPLPLVLRFERSGEVHIERGEDSLVIYLARHVPAYRSGVAAAALRAVHPDRGLPFRVKAAFRGEETLVLLVRIAEAQADLPVLDAVVKLLTRLADEAETAGAGA